MRDAASAKGQLRTVVDKHAPALVALSHDLHSHPELRWEEHRSVRKLSAVLAERGFTVAQNVAGLETAFHASFGGGSRRVAFIAEYDALEGLGHACGHNIIASSALGAAIALAQVANELDISVEVFGTPAEEGGGGKILMLNEGAFEGVEVAMMIHPGPANSLWARPLAVAHFDITYAGQAAHASAYPALGVNAADAMTIAQVAIGMLRQQLPSTARVHGIVREAGTAPNSIPDHAHASWYVRAANLEELDETFERVRRCFEAGALASGCELTLQETSPRYSEFCNDAALAEWFDSNARSVGRDMDRCEERAGGMNTASTDMGNVSRVVRAIHPYLSINSLPAVNHQKEFAVAAATPAADRAVIDGAYLLAATAVDYLFA